MTSASQIEQPVSLSTRHRQESSLGTCAGNGDPLPKVSCFFHASSHTVLDELQLCLYMPFDPSFR
jgi:hypothetical protein